MAIPAFPTIDSVFADWNKLHREKYGTYVDLRSARPEEVQAQVERLVPELQVKQQEWLEKYGDTPEARAIQQEPVPTWNDVYSQWEPLHIKQYGQIVDRPWNADEAAKTQKESLDNDYRNALKAYNEKYGTNFQPNESVLGADAQPSVFVSPEDDGNFFTDVFLPVAGAIGGAYFLGPVLAPSFGSVGGAAAGGAIGSAGGQLAGTGSIDLEQVALAAIAAGGGEYLLGGGTGAGEAGGSGISASAGGETGLLAGSGGITGITPPAGFELAPNLGAGVGSAAGLLGPSEIDLIGTTDLSKIGETGLTPGAAGEGIQVVTPPGGGAATIPGIEAPGLSAMGGAQGITVPIQGGGVVSEMGFIPPGATPSLGDPASFINNPDYLGSPVISEDYLGLTASDMPSDLSVQDALRLANKAQSLLGQQPQVGGLLGGQGGGGQSMGVDYSGLLALLRARAGTPNVASLLAPAVNRYQPLTTQQSLLG